MKINWKELHQSIFQLVGRLGCHQLSHRSFHIRGYQFPLCARCTGLVLGYLVGVLLSFHYHFAFYWGLILLAPMGIDWGLQAALKKESQNYRRFVVGILGGIGQVIVLGNLFGLYK